MIKAIDLIAEVYGLSSSFSAGEKLRLIHSLDGLQFRYPQALLKDFSESA